MIVSIGSAVSGVAPSLKAGAKVVTHMVPHIPDGQLPVMTDILSGLGGQTNGTLTRYGVFHHSALVPMSEKMSFEEAATLTCSGLTAWNALMGLRGMQVKKGDWVLVQGTGGVSVAALQVSIVLKLSSFMSKKMSRLTRPQIAVAAGAMVVATTSTEAKADRLRSLGASHVLNYRTEPGWGEAARKLTPEQRGFDQIVDVGGPVTLSESIKAIRVHGMITLVGFIAGLKSGDVPVEVISALWNLCIFRGVLLGSRTMMKEMVEWLETKGVKPALDDVVFSLEDAAGAYEALEEQKHFSKVVIKIA